MPNTSPIRDGAATQTILSVDTTTTAGCSSTQGTSIDLDVPHKPSSALKKEGWSSFMREVRSSGTLVVTHRNQPEAVVLSVERYQELVRLAQRERVREAQQLVQLRAQFDQRLASLNAPSAHQALKAFHGRAA